jgi:hypothetical protein
MFNPNVASSSAPAAAGHAAVVPSCVTSISVYYSDQAVLMLTATHASGAYSIVEFGQPKAGPRLQVFDQQPADVLQYLRQRKYEQVTIGLLPGEHFTRITTTYANAKSVMTAATSPQPGSQTAAGVMSLRDRKYVSSIALSTSSRRQFGPYPPASRGPVAAAAATPPSAPLSFDRIVDKSLRGIRHFGPFPPSFRAPAAAAAASSANLLFDDRIVDKDPRGQALGGFQLMPDTRRIAPVWIDLLADTLAAQQATGAALQDVQQHIAAVAAVLLAGCGPPSAETDAAGETQVKCCYADTWLAFVWRCCYAYAAARSHLMRRWQPQHAQQVATQ